MSLAAKVLQRNPSRAFKSGNENHIILEKNQFGIISIEVTRFDALMSYFNTPDPLKPKPQKIAEAGWERYIAELKREGSLDAGDV